MSDSSQVDVTYTYYSGEGDSIPHGPNCHTCMNQLFHEKKLDDVATFYVPTLKGVLTFTSFSLQFLTNAESPFTIKSIPEFMLKLECVSCARKEGYLQGIEAAKGEKNGADLNQRIDFEDDETIVLNETPFDPVRVKIEDESAFGSLDIPIYTTDTHMDPITIKNEMLAVSHNYSFTPNELLDMSCYPQRYPAMDSEDNKNSSTIMETGEIIRYENIKQEVNEEPSSYFDYQMDTGTSDTNNASTSDAPNKFQCHICSWETNVRRNLARHLKKHSRVQPFDCKFCGKGFVSTTEMKVHLQRKHNAAEPHYQCFLCELSLKVGALGVNQRFKSESELKEHMLTHVNDVMECSICLRRFYDESKLKEHYQTHNEDKKFECHLCEKKFQHKRDMLRHVTRHHNSGQSKFNCDLCEKSFSRNDGLRRHNILVHSDLDKMAVSSQ